MEANVGKVNTMIRLICTISPVSAIEEPPGSDQQSIYNFYVRKEHSDALSKLINMDGTMIVPSPPQWFLMPWI